MAWMLYVLGTGTLLSVAALALETMLRRAKLPTRWVWVASLAGIALLAVIAPHSEAPLAARTNQVAVAPLTVLQATQRAPNVFDRIAQSRRTAAAALASSMTTAQQRSDAIAGPLALAWLLVSGVLLSLLVIITRRADLVRIRWPRAEVRGVHVRVAPATGPAVIGLARPDIVLPGWLMQRPEAEQHLVVLHESEHVAARDQLLPIGAWIVAALLPWHPAVWWSMARLRLAIELDCDARVLHRGVQPHSYGSLLIDIAGQCAGYRIGALALADRPSHLERRLLAMKQARSRIGIARAGSLTAIAALAIVMACEARIPTAADVDRMNVAEMEKVALRSRLIERSALDTVRFYVNELEVTEAEAKMLPAKRIATVNIAKSAKGGLKEIRISTDSAPLPTNHLILKTEALPGDTVEAPKGIQLRKVGFTGAMPLVFIDGVESSESALAALPTSSIATVDIIKGVSAKRLYGSWAGVVGVVSVKTKTP